MKTTLADLILNARAVAAKAFTTSDPLTQQTAKLEGFKSAGFGTADFLTWENAFNAELEMLAAFSKQPSPAAAATVKTATQTPPTPAPTAG